VVAHLHDHHAPNCHRCVSGTRGGQLALRFDLGPFASRKVHDVYIVGSAGQTYTCARDWSQRGGSYSQTQQGDPRAFTRTCCSCCWLCASIWAF
jgi:hypothetical protein